MEFRDILFIYILRRGCVDDSYLRNEPQMSSERDVAWKVVDERMLQVHLFVTLYWGSDLL